VGDLNTVHITTGFEEDWPSVTMDTATPSTTHFGELHELKMTEGAEVEFSVEDDSINITVNNTVNNAHTSPTPPIASLQHSGAFQVTTTDGCQIAGMELPRSFPVTSLSEYEIPSVDITGQANTLNLSLSLAEDKNVEILMGSQLPDIESQFIVPKGVSIKKIILLRKDMVRGQPVFETAVKRGEIRYLAYPSIEPMSFGKSNFVFFGQMQNFRIEKIIYDPSENAFKVSLNGFATESVRTYPQGFPENIREYRLTYSDIVKVGKFSKLMFEMLLWIIPIILGVVGIISIMVKLSDDDMTKLADKVSASLNSKK
jgi:hypothetical protein